MKKGLNMLSVYCYERCSTCQKALKWLDANGLEYRVMDIRADHPNEETLRKLYLMSGLPLKRFFNTSGMLYRQMGLAKKLADMDEEEQIKLLATNGMLVKRPLLFGDNLVLCGFRENEWSEKLL